MIAKPHPTKQDQRISYAPAIQENNETQIVWLENSTALLT